MKHEALKNTKSYVYKALKGFVAILLLVQGLIQYD